jgi:hypothetical protein
MARHKFHLHSNQIYLPYPHAGQKKVLSEAARINDVDAGRRWRKTTMGMHIAIPKALNGISGLWTAPTYDQVRIGWHEMYQALIDCEYVSFSKSEMVMDFRHTGARVVFRSMDDPDNARGHTAGYIICDEAAMMSPVAWYEVLRPMIMDTRGDVWRLSTPKGHNWWWKEFKNSERFEDHMAWQIPTVGARIVDGELIRDPHQYENPEIPFDEINSMFKTMPERSFRQEVLAEFVENEGQVFRNVYECAKSLVVSPYRSEFVIAVDWGRTNDFTVILTMDTRTRKIVDADAFNQIDWYVQEGRLEAIYRKWASTGSPVYIIAEGNSMGGPLIESLQRAELPITSFIMSNQSKKKIIEQLALDIEQGNIAYPPIPDLIDQLEAYESTLLPSGLIRYSAVEGMHDDYVIALALANYASRFDYNSNEANNFHFSTGKNDNDIPTVLDERERKFIARI